MPGVIAAIQTFGNRAEMIRKVYKVDPMLCPQCGGRMRVIALLTDYPVVDRIINP